MATTIPITIIQSRRFLAGDAMQIEVDSTVLPDRVPIWGSERSWIGFGRGRFGRGRFGVGRSLGFGQGLFGRGRFAQGVRASTYQTAGRFTAGDYSIRVRAVDRLGNAGDWSATSEIHATPYDEYSRSLAVTGYRIWPKAVVFRWNVTDGFEYVSIT
ncbi:MAG: hypothetical protein WC942_08635 [Clostridia bacterium]|jgi:hypothetical protein